MPKMSLSRIAMNCLETIRNNFIEMDMDLGTMEESYAIFLRFKVAVSKEDIDRVDTLRMNFTNMINHVSFGMKTTRNMPIYL